MNPVTISLNKIESTQRDEVFFNKKWKTYLTLVHLVLNARIHALRPSWKDCSNLEVILLISEYDRYIHNRRPDYHNVPPNPGESRGSLPARASEDHGIAD